MIYVHKQLVRRDWIDVKGDESYYYGCFIILEIGSDKNREYTVLK